MAAFQTEMRNRATDAMRAGMDELERRSPEADHPDQRMRENLALMWPSYFAKPIEAPAMPDISMSGRAYSILFLSISKELPRLAESLGTIEVPVGFLAGGDSPIPVDVATRMTSERIPTSWVEVAPGAGHFPWYERPGCVRAALAHLVGH